MTFVPHAPPGAPEFVVLFLWTGTGWLLADVRGRGWCVPSGHVNQGEAPVEAARREAMEEAGARVHDVHLVGTFQWASATAARTIGAYVAVTRSWLGAANPAEVVRVMVCGHDDLPTNYYTWNELLAQVFTLAREVAGA